VAHAPQQQQLPKNEGVLQDTRSKRQAPLHGVNGLLSRMLHMRSLRENSSSLADLRSFICQTD